MVCQLAPHTVSAEHQHLPGLERNRFYGRIGSNAAACSQRRSQDMPLRVGFGLLSPDDAVVDQTGHVRVIVGKAGNRGAADQIQPTVSDVRIIKPVVEQSNRSAGSPHPMEVGVFTGVVLNAAMRHLEARKQPGARIAGDRVAIHLFDNLNRDAAGFLAALVPAHAIGHDRQPALQQELLIVRGLPIGIAVFIVCALAADVAEACQLNSRPNSLSTPLPKEPQAELWIIPDKASLEDEAWPAVLFPERSGTRRNTNDP